MRTHERPRTTPSPYRQRGRAVEVLACHILRRNGYDVLRTMRYTPAVHLVAWRDKIPRLLFVQVRRTRQKITGPADVFSLWAGDVRALQKISRHDMLSAELWVHVWAGDWHIFEVHPGGITEVESHVD